jgi:tetratricopeptide (TPR) repeat protein
LPRKAAGWGNVARRGAHQVSQRGDEERAWDDSAENERRRGAPRPKPAAQWTRDDGAREWEDDDAPSRRGRRRKAATTEDGAMAPTAAEAMVSLGNKHALPDDIATDIRNAADVATAHHREHLVHQAESAFGAYERNRFSDALRAIKPVAEEAPGVAAVRELAGLAAYRSGRWRMAAGHLEAFGRLSDSTEHLPVLMDCQRAMHKPKKVAALWAELRQSSPEPDVLAEGRIVAAASLADAGDLNGAIAMLSTAGATKALRNPSERHIRQWYLLADLYERAGDVPKAREYFERLFRTDPEAYDVAERLRGLGPERRTRAPRRTKAKTATSTKTGPPPPTKTKSAPAKKS